MTLTKEQFIEKYRFEKPCDTKDRDMIIKSNLSDIKIILSSDPMKAMAMLDHLKYFMWDTEDVRDGN